jgi:hypothetical protein
MILIFLDIYDEISLYRNVNVGQKINHLHTYEKENPDP